MSKRVRVNVSYGSTYQGGGELYTYLVRQEQANVGQTLTVPVRGANGRIYNTMATVVSTSVKAGGVKRPRTSV